MDRRALLALTLGQLAIGVASRANVVLTDALDVSLIALIADPAKFHGKVVLVHGFLRLEFEGNALYVGKQDYDAAIMKNAVWVDVPLSFDEGAGSKLTNHYVLVVGKFNADRLGHLGLFSGTIEQVQRLELAFVRPN